MLNSFLPSFFFPLFPCFFQCLSALLHAHTAAPLNQKFAHSSSIGALPIYPNLRLITFSIFMSRSADHIKN